MRIDKQNVTPAGEAGSDYERRKPFVVRSFLVITSGHAGKRTVPAVGDAIINIYTGKRGIRHDLQGTGTDYCGKNRRQ